MDIAKLHLPLLAPGREQCPIRAERTRRQHIVTPQVIELRQQLAVTATLVPNGVGPGSYDGAILVSSATGGEIAIPVRLTVTVA